MGSKGIWRTPIYREIHCCLSFLVPLPLTQGSIFSWGLTDISLKYHWLVQLSFHHAYQPYCWSVCMLRHVMALTVIFLYQEFPKPILFSYYTVYFEIIVGSHIAIRINTEKSYVPFTLFFLMVTSCKTLVQYYNQDIGIHKVKL